MKFALPLSTQHALLPLILLVLAGMWLAWQLTQVRFSPYEDTITLSEAQLLGADHALCPASISDSLATADVVDKSLPDILTDCVQGVLTGAGGQGQAVQLPHEWRKDMAGMLALQEGRAVYRLKFAFSVPPPGLWVVALPATGQNPAVFVNGKLLGWGGSFEAPVARNAARPLLFSVPQGLLVAGDNYFDVYVVSQPATAGFLDQITIGPAEMLEPSYQRYYFFRSTLPQVITLVIVVLSAAMCALWFYRKQDVEYGWCALGGFFWAIHTLNQFVVNIPFSAHSWDWLMAVSAGCLSLTGVYFIHRFVQHGQSRWERWLVLACVLLALALLLLPEALFYQVLAWFWNPLVFSGLVYVFYFTLMQWWKIRSRELYVLAAAGGVIVLLGLYDLAVAMGGQRLPYGQFLHLGAPFLLVAFTWILLQRFVQSLRAMEGFNQELLRLNQELEGRVEEKTRKIAQSYETIRLLGQEQILLHERSRIMRDMHDGIGVYLTSMLRQLESGPVDRVHLREAAHNALNDLRLMIDSLGSASSDLPAMLGMFRTRIGVALDACQVELEWQVDELPPLQDFGPERALNLLRILQEAFTNALKHSGASCIRLSAQAEMTGMDSGRIRIEVHDNGKGLDQRHVAGNGLKNMRYRAQKIKADFMIDPDRDGTCIVIILPLIVNHAERNQPHT